MPTEASIESIQQALNQLLNEISPALSKRSESMAADPKTRIHHCINLVKTEASLAPAAPATESTVGHATGVKAEAGATSDCDLPDFPTGKDCEICEDDVYVKREDLDELPDYGDGNVKDEVADGVTPDAPSDRVAPAPRGKG